MRYSDNMLCEIYINNVFNRYSSFPVLEICQDNRFNFLRKILV